MNRYAQSAYIKRQAVTQRRMAERRERGFVPTGSARECRECGGFSGHYGYCDKVR